MKNPAPITVLFVIDSLGTGGAEWDLAEQLPRLDAHGVRSIVVSLRHRDEGVQASLQQQGFDVRILAVTNPLAQALALRRIVRRERPDVVHTVLFRADIAGRIASLGTRSRVVTRLVNTDYDPIRLRDPNVHAGRLRLTRIIDGWTARHLTQHVYANSEAVKVAAVRDLGLPRSQVTVIRESRDASRLGRPSAERRLEARRMLGLEPDQPVLVNVGRLDYQKGQTFLLEALIPLVERWPRLMLLIAGRHGDASPGLEQQCDALRLRSHVRFLGHREDVPEILAAADLFVFPTLFEGLPGAVLEAMALGLPIVASDIAPVREAVEADRNALLVPRGESGALAAAIASLLGDSVRARAFGLESRRLLDERIPFDASTRQFAEYLLAAAGQSADGALSASRSPRHTAPDGTPP